MEFRRVLFRSGLRIRLAPDLDRRVEPLCGAAALRGTEDLLHYAALDPPAGIRGFHRQGRPAALFPRAISDQPVAPPLRVQRHPDPAANTRQEGGEKRGMKTGDVQLCPKTPPSGGTGESSPSPFSYPLFRRVFQSGNGPKELPFPRSHSMLEGSSQS